MSGAAVALRTAGGWRRGGTLAAGLVLGGALAGALAGALVSGGRTPLVVVLAVTLVPLVLWRRPDLGPPALLLIALTVEQSAVGTGAKTDELPIFHGMGGAHISPADCLCALVLGIWALRRDPGARRARSATGLALAALVVAVLAALVIGASHGGDSRMAMLEVRPYVYLTVSFLAASALLDSLAAVRRMLWVLVLASGFKAAQATLIFLSVRHQNPRPESVLGHEEALFFGLFLFVCAALWLYDVPGALRRTSTALLPIVVVGELANGRRTAWLVLGAGLLLLLVVAYLRLPERRRFVRRLGLVLCAIAAVYLPTFWNGTGGFAQPARAVRSVVEPGMRDASSDLYRLQENANLELNIRNSGLLGAGFGVPINYALPITDISDIDPFIAYIPHNGVLYVQLRLGLLGSIAFWCVLAAGIVSAAALVKSRDRELAVLGSVVVCAVVAYALQGYNDQGFFFFRVAFVMGSLLGTCAAATRVTTGPRAGEAQP